jgi:2-polyprenyl-3-methyl-5-hydroxy-6-metoxy-1,4-benzoquinol methylase
MSLDRAGLAYWDGVWSDGAGSDDPSSGEVSLVSAVSFVHDIPDDGPVYVYGAGSGGAKVLDELKTLGRHTVLGVADSARRGRLLGYEILSPSELRERVPSNATIVIASQYAREIAETLRWHERVCNAYPLLRRRSLLGLDDPTMPRLFEFFKEHLGESWLRGRRYIEIGCGHSAWLPRVAMECGLDVTGLDYSEPGCRSAREALALAGVPGEVVREDLFAPPPRLVEQFDVAASFGVAEHFDDTSAIIAAIAKYVRPGGVVFTLVPNVTRSIGWLQQLLHRPVYDIHVPLDRSALARAHRDAGLAIQECRYLLPTYFGVCNLHGQDERSRWHKLKKRTLDVLTSASLDVLRLSDRIGGIPETQLFSPFVVCIAKKPDL